MMWSGTADVMGMGDGCHRRIIARVRPLRGDVRSLCRSCNQYSIDRNPIELSQLDASIDDLGELSHRPTFNLSDVRCPHGRARKCR